MMLTQNAVLKHNLIGNWAVQQHRNTGCTYGGSHDVSLHLEAVVEVAKRHAPRYFDEQECLLLYSACWCHDLIEDCRLTYNDLRKETSAELADIVYAVTNEMGRNRRERATKTYPKIKGNSHATFVKLCDRIANSLFSAYSGSSMFEKYRSENAEFKAQLFTGEFPEMWEELDRIFDLR